MRQIYDTNLDLVQLGHVGGCDEHRVVLVLELDFDAHLCRAVGRRVIERGTVRRDGGDRQQDSAGPATSAGLPTANAPLRALAPIPP